MIEAIFFDFDGVIMDSMALKLDSYAHALRDYEFDRDDISRIMAQHMGTSRRKILVEMYRELKGEVMPADSFARALQDFNAQDAASVPRMPFVPGSLEFIKSIHRDRFTAVVTGTPHDVIQDTARYHGLTSYFDVIRGTPDAKTQIVSEELKRHSLNPERSIFIGDGLADQRAADNCGMRFVGVRGEFSSFEPESAWMVVNDLNEIEVEAE